LKPVMAFLRARGVRAVIYLDDILFLNQDPEKLRLELQDAVALLENLGFLINWGKSMIEPSQTVQYLGVIICSLRMSFSLPEDRLIRMKQKCTDLLSRKRVRLRDLASVMGNFAWSILSIPFAQSHYRRVQSALNNSLSRNGGNFDCFITLSSDERAELSWWITTAESVNGRPFFPFEPDSQWLGLLLQWCFCPWPLDLGTET